MSLLRLLTTGKSLDGVGDSVNRYRVVNARLLPKFGTSNPFPVGAAVAPASRPKAAPTPEPSPQGEACAEDCGSQPEILEAKPSAKVGWIGRWIRWLTGNRKAKALPARPKTLFRPATRPGAVQGELLLDEVKVVRNDLTDTDLEIVAVKKPKPGSADAAKSTPAPRKSWKGVAERLVKANQA